MTSSTTTLKAPFLRRIYSSGAANGDDYPFNLPYFKNGKLDIEFRTPVTFLAGENGAGKSTLLETIAATAGFNPEGGSSNHLFGSTPPQRLTNILRLSWLPKIRRGFFFRAESFFSFSNYIDDLAREDSGILSSYGGRSLHARSHGESFLALFESRFRSARGCLFVLDEPEAALSPGSQLRFLRLLKMMEQNNNQVILASHSPILMAYPGSEVLLLEDGLIRPITFSETSQFLLWREFIKRPNGLVEEFLKS